MNATMTKPTRRTSPADDQWRRLFLRLRAVAQSIVGGRAGAARAEDLAQETIARLLRADRDPAEYAYARRTLIHLYLDEERSMRRRLRRHVERFAITPRAHIDRDSIDEDEQVAAARAALDTLTPLQRAAFALRVIENMSYEEIAGALGATPGAARSSVYAARKRIADTIGEEPS